MKTQGFLLIAIVSGFLVPACQGAIVTRTVTGVITTVNTNGQAGTAISGGLGTVQVGDTFTSTISFDSATGGADLDSTNNLGFFRLPSSADSFVSIEIDGSSFSTATATGGILAVSTFDNVQSTFNNNTDALDARGTAVSLPTGWISTTPTASLTVLDPSGTALSSDALPSTFSSAWSIGAIALSFNNGLTIDGVTTPDVFIEGTFQISAVPEPSSCSLFAGALVLLRVRRRRS